jgi:hypothetical protein
MDERADRTTISRLGRREGISGDADSCSLAQQARKLAPTFLPQQVQRGGVMVARHAPPRVGDAQRAHSSGCAP